MSRPFLSFDPFIFLKDIIFFFSFILFLLIPIFFEKNIFYFFIKKIKNIIILLFPSPDFFSKGVLGILFCLFSFLTLLNFLSLWSYIFSPAAHIIITFSIGLLIWLRIFISQCFIFFYRKIEHFTPQGTPIWLLPLIVLIEIIRQIIRPITLRVRLAANLTAGHLILSLLASLSLSIRFFIQIPLILLEFLVSIVQPFVFCILLFLYYFEN